jgi:hypothetical protein
MAAYTTLFASIIYFLMSGIRRKKILEIIVEKKDFISIIFANVVMCICVIISSVLPIQGYILIISKGMIGVISYFATWLAIRKILW